MRSVWKRSSPSVDWGIYLYYQSCLPQSLFFIDALRPSDFLPLKLSIIFHKTRITKDNNWLGYTFIWPLSVENSFFGIKVLKMIKRSKPEWLFFSKNIIFEFPPHSRNRPRNLLIVLMLTGVLGMDSSVFIYAHFYPNFNWCNYVWEMFFCLGIHWCGIHFFGLVC